MKALSLEIEGVCHRHPGATLDTPPELSFSIPPGGRALLLGPNGCGKTTLMQRIVGLFEGVGGITIYQWFILRTDASRVIQSLLNGRT